MRFKSSFLMPMPLSAKVMTNCFPTFFGRNDEFYRHFRTPVFEGIVQKVVHQVGEVHSVRIDDRVFRIDMCLDRAVGIILLHFELESHGGFFHHGIGFQLVELEVDGSDTVKHRNLQYLFRQHAQPFRFRQQYTVVVSHLFGRQNDAPVGEHLCHERNGGNRRFELVGHVVDEVRLHLRESFLPVDPDEGEDRNQENEQAEDDQGSHEAHFPHEITAQIGEPHHENAHMCGRIVGKDLLLEFGVAEIFVVVLAAQHRTPVCREHFEVIVHLAHRSRCVAIRF